MSTPRSLVTTMQVPLVDLGTQYRAIADEIDAAIRAVLERTDFILGEEVALLEADFAQYIGVNHAIGVGSGLTALELALRAYGIGPGDEVITAANTFIATLMAIWAAGARPVLVDVDPSTYNIDPRALPAAITSRTRAVIPVHLYGQPAELDAILAIATAHHLLVIEDAAQAHGAQYKGRRVGRFGHAAAFSFYPSKNLGAYGDAGMVVTDDAAVAEKIRSARNYGQRTKYHHAVIGTNSRLDTLQAAITRVKLRYLDRWNGRRQQHARAYAGLLASLPIVLPRVAENLEHVYHLYVIQTSDRDRVLAFLQARGIGAGIHYPIPAHLQACSAQLGYRQGDFPVSEAAAVRILSLPMYPELTLEQMEYVADALRQAIAGATNGG